MNSFSIETKKACHTGLKYGNMFNYLTLVNKIVVQSKIYYFQRRKIRMRILLIEHPNLSKYFKY